MLGGISAGYYRDLAGLQRGWRRLLLRRRTGRERQENCVGVIDG